jgi:hypothetical protein
MTLKICPVVGSISLGSGRGLERAPPPEDPAVSVDGFIGCSPAILKPTPLRWLRFKADPARNAPARLVSAKILNDIG